MSENDLSRIVFNSALKVHQKLGPGLLESVYHKCMLHELKSRGINFQSEVTVPINYKGLDVEAELRCDILVENILIVELKSVSEIKPIFEAQILTYMNLFKSPIGLLINFNVTHIFKEGQKTYINKLYNELWD